MLQQNRPSSRWLVKDTNKNLLAKTIKVTLPLSVEDELVMFKMIDFVDFSLDPTRNKNNVIPAVGIAAPQIGSKLAMYYIHFQTEKNGQLISQKYAMINPEITSRSTLMSALNLGEGCLSVDEKREGYPLRHFKIKVKGYDYLQKKEIALMLSGYEAIVFQHEQDHLEQKLYYHRINENEKKALEAENMLVMI